MRYKFVSRVYRIRVLIQHDADLCVVFYVALSSMFISFTAFKTVTNYRSIAVNMLQTALDRLFAIYREKVSSPYFTGSVYRLLIS